MLPAATVARSVRVNGLVGAARLATDQAAYDEAAERCAQALTPARELENPRMLVAALNTEGLLAGRRTGTSIPNALIRRHRRSVAVEVGFEPTEGLPLHTLSRRAPSATRRLHRGRAYPTRPAVRLGAGRRTPAAGPHTPPPGFPPPPRRGG